jgi:hypothetical protein
LLALVDYFRTKAAAGLSYQTLRNNRHRLEHWADLAGGRLLREGQGGSIATGEDPAQDVGVKAASAQEVAEAGCLTVEAVEARHNSERRLVPHWPTRYPSQGYSNAFNFHRSLLG